MSPTVQIDTREWSKAAQQLKKTSKRSTVDFLNGQALFVAWQSIKLTVKADRSKIQQQLGIIGHSLRNVRLRKGPLKGKTVLRRGKAIIRQDSFAARILERRFNLTGSWGKGITGSTMEERARQFIARRARSAAFIASGWIWAMRQLWTVVQKKPRITRNPGVQAAGVPKGSAKPANEAQGSKLSALIENTALLQGQTIAPAPGGNPMPIAVQGLQRALDASATDMMEELARRLYKDLAPYNAKPR